MLLRKNLDSRRLKVLGVAGDYGQAVHARRCRDECVDHWRRLRVMLTTPSGSDREGDREDPVGESGLHIGKPALKVGSLL
jgi:hypothetical protein